MQTVELCSTISIWKLCNATVDERALGTDNQTHHENVCIHIYFSRSFRRILVCFLFFGLKYHHFCEKLCDGFKNPLNNTVNNWRRYTLPVSELTLETESYKWRECKRTQWDSLYHYVMILLLCVHYTQFLFIYFPFLFLFFPSLVWNRNTFVSFFLRCYQQCSLVWFGFVCFCDVTFDDEVHNWKWMWYTALLQNKRNEWKKQKERKKLFWYVNVNVIQPNLEWLNA